MRKLMDVTASNRLDTSPLVTHRFSLDRIERFTISSQTSATAS